VFKDNGIGIPKDLISQVFDMFHVATTRSKGYGLGLYIVKKTIEKLKGRIRINSRENEYTRITIIIPNQEQNEIPYQLNTESRPAKAK
jgi:signal transduction histidine kinase